MNFNGNFYKIGTIAVVHFKMLITSPQGWLDYTERQTKYVFKIFNNLVLP